MVGVQIFASLTVRGRKSKGQVACGLTDGVRTADKGWDQSRLGFVLSKAWPLSGFVALDEWSPS